MTYTPPIRSVESQLVNLYAPAVLRGEKVTIPYSELPEKLSNLGRRFHLRAREKGQKLSVQITPAGYVVQLKA